MAERAWIRRAIENWARWADARQAGTVGYATTNILARAAGGGTASTDHVPIGVQAAELLDRLVQGLRQHDPEGWAVLMCIYIGDPRLPQRRRMPMTTQAVARLMGRCTDTIVRQRCASEDWIADQVMADHRSRRVIAE